MRPVYPRTFAGAVALGMACAPLLDAHRADPCMAQITVLEGKRNAEIVAACHGVPFDECPDVDAIDQKYAPLIEEQVECR
jgi:hypothetical protein